VSFDDPRFERLFNKIMFGVRVSKVSEFHFEYEGSEDQLQVGENESEHISQDEKLIYIVIKEARCLLAFLGDCDLAKLMLVSRQVR
jgi:hypothetical protein